MKQKNILIDRLYQSVNIMICESKTAKNYGTGHKLTFSDICLLKCISRNENAKASELSLFLGITNGAVTQLAKKLTDKEYLEPYRISGNKKEVYYKLTPSGEKACSEYDRHHNARRRNLENYIEKLDEETIQKIIGLFDAVADNSTVDEHCSVKHSNGCHDNEENMTGRCEKCKAIY